MLIIPIVKKRNTGRVKFMLQGCNTFQSPVHNKLQATSRLKQYSFYNKEFRLELNLNKILLQ